MSYLLASKRNQQRLLLCGGASGHLQHLWDNLDLTFAEIKEVISSAAEGKLERSSEKLDGINLVFSWNVNENQLKVARSGGDIKRGGMNAKELATKFFGRGNLSEAFDGAFKVLNDAVGSLPESVKLKIFGSNSNKWYALEIVYTLSPNVINYDSNNIIFHGWPIFLVKKDGSVDHTDDDSGVSVLASRIEQMQKAVTLKDWRVRGPSLLNLKQISNGSVVQKALNQIEQAMRSANVTDENSLYDYLSSLMREELADYDLNLTSEIEDAVVSRAAGREGSLGIPQVKKIVPKESQQAVGDFLKSTDELKKQMMLPIETAIHQFALEVLRGLKSTLISKSDEEVNRLKAEVTKAINAISSSGSQSAMDVLQKEMQRLGGVENINTPMEGIVFFFKGQAYKFTGSFAASNQILNLFRYGRKGIPAMNMGENQLKEVLDRCLNKWKRFQF